MKRFIKATLIALALVACGESPADDEHVIDRRAEFRLDNLPEETILSPQGTAEGEAEIGSVRQPVTVVTMWHGWQTNKTTRPAFLDIGNDAQYNLEGHCGANGAAGRGCLLPKGPDEKIQWTWRWDKVGCGKLDIGVTDVFSGTQFLASARDAMASINSANLGITMTEVTSGEDITLFCDANATAVLDPDNNIAASWFPFGSTADTQRSLIGAADHNCNNGSNPGTIFRVNPVWTYTKAGITLNADVLANPRNATSWVNPSICSAAAPRAGATFAGNLFFNIVLHETLHHLGFHHFDADPLLRTNPSCDDFGNRRTIDNRMKTAIKNLRTRRCTNRAGYICQGGVGACPDDCRIIFQPNTDLECIDPGDPLSSGKVGAP